MAIINSVFQRSRVGALWMIVGMMLVVSGCTSKARNTPVDTTIPIQASQSPIDHPEPTTMPVTNGVRPATLVVAVRVVKPGTHVTISVDGVIVLDGVRDAGWSGRYTSNDSIRVQTADETAIEYAAQGTEFRLLGPIPDRPITFEYLR